MSFKNNKAEIPIICVGNIYLGGTGKTPLVKEIFSIVKTLGKNPAFIKKKYDYLIDEIKMLEKDGTSVVRHAIKGMLPKNKLGRAILKNCYIYSSEEHNQNAQKPELLNLKNLK